MKFLLGVTLAAMAMATATEASAQRVRFEGVATIIGFSGTCPDYNPTGGTFVTRFRPAGVGSNPANSGLSFFALGAAGTYNYTLPGAFDGIFRTVTETEIFDYVGNQPDSRVRFVAQQPATITPTTNFVNVTGQIDNFDFMTGCRVSFIMSAAQRP